MVQRAGKNWGLRAAACAAVVVWQIYEMASARVFASNESDTLRYVVIGAALFGLIASLLKLSADY
jgi:Zn-dependent protease